jgi:hypothetical protein
LELDHQVPYGLFIGMDNRHSQGLQADTDLLENAKNAVIGVNVFAGDVPAIPRGKFWALSDLIGNGVAFQKSRFLHKVHIWHLIVVIFVGLA